MKKIIFVVLMTVMIATPCLAQEIAPEGIFSLHGTVWQEYLGITILPIPGMPGFDPTGNESYFYGGRVYNSWGSYMGSYVDLLAFSFSFSYSFLICETGIWFPAVGIGTSIEGGLFHGIFPYLRINLFNKIEDNWVPEETIDSIYPSNGARGTTLTGVQISTSYTTFKKNSLVEVIFDPPDGLTVSSIYVANDSYMYFDLEIAVDAPVGAKRVIVIYDKGRKVVENSDIVFIVAPPGEIVSISPNEGEQGTTLTDVTIMGADTTFEDDGVSAILLMPPGGFTVSNINVISNTEIEFDLEIAVDAPVGSKSVIVTYDDGIAYLYNSEVVFEIMEKTN